MIEGGEIPPYRHEPEVAAGVAASADGTGRRRCHRRITSRRSFVRSSRQAAVFAKGFFYSLNTVFSDRAADA